MENVKNPVNQTQIVLLIISVLVDGQWAVGTYVSAVTLIGGSVLKRRTLHRNGKPKKKMKKNSHLLRRRIQFTIVLAMQNAKDHGLDINA